MKVLGSVFSFMLGASVGSFLNVAAWRIPRGESIVSPPSRCTTCGTSIKWYDNVPILSWILLRGRCRYCGNSFSVRYAVVELVTALMFLGLYLNFGPSITSLKYGIFLSLMICSILTDMDHWLILDEVSIGGTVAGLVLSLLPGGGGLPAHLAAAAGAFLLFLAIRTGAELALRGKPGYTIAPEGFEDQTDEFQGGMGWGDVKLAGMMGAFLGPSLTAVALFFAFLAGGIVGVFLLATGKNRRVPVPFGPFMALGSMTAVFAGKRIIEAYLGLVS